MSEKPDVAEIVAAVEASGYLLEQRVADVFESLGYHVETNYAFLDTAQEVSRELDVRAFRREYHDVDRNEAVWVDYLAECKKSPEPLVFFSRAKTGLDQRREPQEYVFTCGSRMEPTAENPKAFSEVPAFRHLGLADGHWSWARREKATQFCRIGRGGKGSWKADHGNVYNGLLVPLAKALIAEQKRVGPVDGQSGYAWLWVPMVVTTAPLYVIDSTTRPPVARAVTHATLTRAFSGSALQGVFSFEFVQVDALQDFVQGSVDPFVKRVVDIAQAQNGRLFRRPT